MPVTRVVRIVANIATTDPARAKAFYEGVLGLELAMDLGFIRTYAAAAEMRVQISFASEGGSGTPVPALSIEVDDVDAVLARVKRAKLVVEYGPVDEPWGVRRFYVRDPLGTLVNILGHAPAPAKANAVKAAVGSSRSARAGASASRPPSTSPGRATRRARTPKR